MAVLVILLLVHSVVVRTPTSPPYPRRSVVVETASAPPSLGAGGDPKRIVEDALERADETRRLAAAAARALAPTTIDDVLDAFRVVGLGDPRIVVTEVGRKQIEVPLSRTSLSVREADCEVAAPVCVYEAGFLAGGFGAVARRPVTVHEIECSARDAAACTFEVSY
jgi:hypothetical protein